MKTRSFYPICTILISLIWSCSQKPTEEISESSDVSDLQYYGDKITGDNSSTVKDLANLMFDKDSVEIKLEATIIETCEMKGCWMTVDLGNDEEMRVTFKDYGFFVPKEGVEGRRTIFQGTVKRTLTNVETLRHFAKDAGKSEDEILQITEPLEELAFVATGVIIDDNE